MENKVQPEVGTVRQFRPPLLQKVPRASVKGAGGCCQTSKERVLW